MLKSIKFLYFHIACSSVLIVIRKAFFKKNQMPKEITYVEHIYILQFDSRACRFDAIHV